MKIDTTFDVRADSNGRDPDRASATLRSYHQQLWSKQLPDGSMFTLERRPGKYLVHESPKGEWELGSDAITHTYSRWKRTADLIQQISKEDVESFFALSCTVGAYIVFPKDPNRKPTINQARGTNSVICDRFDLTLECIRRQYLGQENPLEDALGNYWDFFELFESFDQYVSLFLLDDLIDTESGKIKFWLPFDDFSGPAIPLASEEYSSYREQSMDFLTARNERIEHFHPS